jgi:hypothetical protein
MMNTFLSGLNETRCFVYRDDIVIYASSLADHDVKLRVVLDRLRTHRLKLQPEKREFFGSKLLGPPNNRIRNEAGPPKGSRYSEIPDTHYGKATKNVLRNDQLL